MIKNKLDKSFMKLNRKETKTRTFSRTYSIDDFKKFKMKNLHQ